MTIRDLVTGSTGSLVGILFDFSLPGGDPADGVFFDASLSESHSREVMRTDSPIEEGADITDHLRQTPASVRVSGLLANQSVSALDQVVDALQNGPWGGTRAKEAWQKLQDLHANRELVTIVTDLQVYEKMVITSLSADLNPEAGDSIPVEFTASEIFFAETETVLEEEEAAKTGGATPPKSKGADVGTKAPADVSIAAQLFDAGKEAVGEAGSFIKKGVDKLTGAIGAGP